MTKQEKDLYLGRGIHDSEFLTSLVSGNLCEMRNVIRKMNEGKEGEKKLDIQIRNNYLNIYYRGSNAGRVKNENIIEFDKFYFYNSAGGFKLNSKGKMPAKKEIEKDADTITKLEEKRDDLIKLFSKNEYGKYFEGAKKAIDNWLNDNKKPEREIQHKMVTCNTLKDYTIIDIEFQVSTKSDYPCKHKKESAKEYANPRFDIIAVNTMGELCVIELKKGIGALKGTSGLVEHWGCFNKSIGDKDRNKPFVKEMGRLLKQKQNLKLIEAGISIKGDNVQFLFAYEYKTADHAKEEKAFHDVFLKIPLQERSKITILWLKNGMICKQNPQIRTVRQ